MIPIAVAVSYALKAQLSDLPHAFQTRRGEFKAAVKEIIRKYDFYRLGHAAKLKNIVFSSSLTDEVYDANAGCTVGARFDKDHTGFVRLRGLPCIKTWDGPLYMPFEEVLVAPRPEYLEDMGTALNFLCDFFATTPQRLSSHMSNFQKDYMASALLVKLPLCTTHLKKNKPVKFHHFDLRGSSLTPAYRGHLGITVRQHFFSRHRLELEYPQLPCVAVAGGNDHFDYFPLEVLSLGSH